MRARLKKLGQRKFVRDTVVLQVSHLIQSSTYLVTSVLTARLLGSEELGRWTTCRELYMFMFFLVNMGLTNACVSRYSKAKGAGDEAEAVAALAALIKLGLLMSALVATLGWLVAPWAAERFYADRDVGVVTAILGLSCLGEVLRSLALAVLNGTRQMTRYATFDALTNVLRVGLVGGALLIERSVHAVGWAYLAHGLLSGLLGLRAYRQARQAKASLAPPPFREVLAALPGASLREAAGLSALLAVGKAVNTVVPRLGPILIPALAAEKEAAFHANGQYQVGQVLTMVVGGVVGAIATNLLPTLGLKMGQSDVPFETMGRLFRRLALAAGGVTVAATLLSIPAAWLAIRLFYGSAYEEGFEFYLLLSAGNLLLGFGVIVEPFYIYAKRMHHHLIQVVIYATLGTIGLALATQHFGPKGAALASGLCNAFVIFHLVYIWAYFRGVRSRRERTLRDTHQGNTP